MISGITFDERQSRMTRIPWPSSAESSSMIKIAFALHPLTPSGSGILALTAVLHSSRHEQKMIGQPPRFLERISLSEIAAFMDEMNDLRSSLKGEPPTKSMTVKL
jgi:hypothetical protein